MSLNISPINKSGLISRLATPLFLGTVVAFGGQNQAIASTVENPISENNTVQVKQEEVPCNKTVPKEKKKIPWVKTVGAVVASYLVVGHLIDEIKRKRAESKEAENEDKKDKEQMDMIR